MDREIYIVGGGESLKGFNLKQLENKTSIAVNKAIYYYNPTYFLTKDTDFLILMVSNPPLINKVKKYFIVDTTRKDIEVRNKSIVCGHLIFGLDTYEGIIKSNRKDGFSLEYNDFRHGDNSGYSALQFAILMGYNQIYLLGFDLTIKNQTHFHNGYGESIYSFQKRLREYYQTFEKGLKELQKERPDINIYSCSKISRLNDIIKYKELKL